MELYSSKKRREQKAKDGSTDVYQYVKASDILRAQFLHLMEDALGAATRYEMYERVSNPRYSKVRDVLLREYGRYYLVKDIYGPYDDIFAFAQICTTDEFLDLVQLTLSLAVQSKGQSFGKTEKMSAEKAIHLMNQRFREDGLGFQFENGHIIRMDSQLFHSEVVKPALLLLQNKRFAKANEEFLLAHEHFRHGKKKDSVVAANRSFESAMKAVCTAKGWEYSSKARASDLVKVLKANCFWPEYANKSVDQLISVLASGLPEVRNNSGGHGESPTSPEVSDQVVKFALNLTAANILFLADSLDK